jgi:hypothetical protein
MSCITCSTPKPRKCRAASGRSRMTSCATSWSRLAAGCATSGQCTCATTIVGVVCIVLASLRIHAVSGPTGDICAHLRFGAGCVLCTVGLVLRIRVSRQFLFTVAFMLYDQQIQQISQSTPITAELLSLHQCTPLSAARTLSRRRARRRRWATRRWRAWTAGPPMP